MKIALQWPGGEHQFALPLGQLRSLQVACDAGPMQIYNALRFGSWRVEMPEHTLRLGLIGAGMDDLEAKRLVSSMMDARPLAEFVGPAAMVLAAALVGVEGDPVGEPVGVTMSPPENGSSAPSTRAE